MNTTLLAILGICGGFLCAIADLFLDLKGVNNRKLGRMGAVDSAWERMPHYRFTVSMILALVAVPLYACGAIALGTVMKAEHPVFALIFEIVMLVGAMGGFMIHTFLTSCPTMYKAVYSRSSRELAIETVEKTFSHIFPAFLICYVALVIVSSGMAIVAIVLGFVDVPIWCVLLNPVVFQVVGLLFRATKLKCFIDAPSCCAASLGLAMFGVIALLAL